MRSILILLFFLLTLTGVSQDLMNSAPLSAPQEVNPTYTGNDTCSSARISYRLQWPQLAPGMHQTYVAVSMYMPKEFMYAGVSYKYIYDGVTDLRCGSLFFSKYIKLSAKQELRVGASMGLYSGLLDWNRVDFSDQVDSSGNGAIYPSGDVARGGWFSGADINVGLSYHLRGFHIGVAAYHANRPNVSVLLGQSTMPVRFSAVTGYTFDFAWFTHQQVTGIHAVFNQHGTYGTLMFLFTNTVDGRYGLNYAVEIQEGVNKHSFQLSYTLKWFTLGYAFDYYSKSHLKELGHAHEFFLRYQFWKRTSKRKSGSLVNWN